MSNHSILRQCQHKALKESAKKVAVLFNNENPIRVIDLGGKLNSIYQLIFRVAFDKEIDLATVDLSPNDPSVISANLELPWTFHTNKNEPYKIAIAFNLLEHIYNFNHILNETNRLLENGGIFMITTPFMLQIHQHPKDFFRYTPDSFTQMLQAAGFEVLNIEPLGFGFFSLFFQMIGGYIKPEWLMKGIRIICISIDRGLAKISKTFASVKTRLPLGYFVVARKM